MIGELISTGVTFGTGRKAINSAFSGTAEFNNVILDSGGNFSGGTGGGAILSGGTDLYNIFLTTSAAADITRVQPGTNIATGGTANFPVINLNSAIELTSVKGTTLSGDTIYSGSTDVDSIIRTIAGASSTNFANTDLTLTGSRVHNLDANELRFSAGTSGTFIVSGDSGGADQIKLLNNTSNTPSYLTIGKGEAALFGKNATLSDVASINAKGGGSPLASIGFGDSGGTKTLAFNSANGATFSDTIDGTGIIYAINYHSTYVDRSLVDKGFVVNHALSGSTGIWSGSTGTNSIIANNASGNVAPGTNAFAIGNETSADGNNSLGFGIRTKAFGDYSLAGGKGFSSSILVTASGETAFNFSETTTNYTGQGAEANSSAILGGVDQNVESGAIMAVIIGGRENTISGTSEGSGIFSSSGSSISTASTNSVILGGKSQKISANNSVTLGGNGNLVASADNTAYMQLAYIDEYIDLNPQTVLPAASTGRMFFSGGSLNRVMVNTGGTADDWIII